MSRAHYISLIIWLCVQMHVNSLTLATADRHRGMLTKYSLSLLFFISFFFSRNSEHFACNVPTIVPMKKREASILDMLLSVQLNLRVYAANERKQNWNKRKEEKQHRTLIGIRTNETTDQPMNE